MVHSYPMSPADSGASADCEFDSRLSAYADGELNADQEAQIESHLAACPACRTQVQEIRELSQLAAAIGVEGMSLAAIRRIHQAVDADQRMRIFRVAGVLTGLAASVMVIGSAWMAELPNAGRGNVPQTIVIDVEHAPAWEKVALNRSEPLPNVGVPMDDHRLRAESSLARLMIESLDGRTR